MQTSNSRNLYQSSGVDEGWDDKLTESYANFSMDFRTTCVEGTVSPVKGVTGSLHTTFSSGRSVGSISPCLDDFVKSLIVTVGAAGMGYDSDEFAAAAADLKIAEELAIQSVKGLVEEESNKDDSIGSCVANTEGFHRDIVTDLGPAPDVVLKMAEGGLDSLQSDKPDRPLWNHELQAIISNWEEDASEVIREHCGVLSQYVAPTGFISKGLYGERRPRRGWTYRLHKCSLSYQFELELQNMKWHRVENGNCNLVICGPTSECPPITTDSWLALSLIQKPTGMMPRVDLTENHVTGWFPTLQGVLAPLVCLKDVKTRGTPETRCADWSFRSYFPFNPKAPGFVRYAKEAVVTPANLYAKAFTILMSFPQNSVHDHSLPVKSPPLPTYPRTQFQLCSGRTAKMRFLRREDDDFVARFHLSADAMRIKLTLSATGAYWKQSCSNLRVTHNVVFDGVKITSCTKIPEGTFYRGWTIMRNGIMISPLTTQSHSGVVSGPPYAPYWMQRMLELLGGVNWDPWSAALDPHQYVYYSGKKYWAIPHYGVHGISYDPHDPEDMIGCPFSTDVFCGEMIVNCVDPPESFMSFYILDAL